MGVCKSSETSFLPFSSTGPVNVIEEYCRVDICCVFPSLGPFFLPVDTVVTGNFKRRFFDLKTVRLTSLLIITVHVAHMIYISETAYVNTLRTSVFILQFCTLYLHQNLLPFNTPQGNAINSYEHCID